MEKQRIKSNTKSCRRLLISFLILFFAGKSGIFAQTLTSSMIRQLRISPVEGQDLCVNSEIKFEVVIPYTAPGKIEVSMPEEINDVTFKTLRKVEKDGGTKIEMWFTFAKTGTYSLKPLVVSIKGSRKQISFDSVTIGINPKEQVPVCVIVTDKGQNKNLSVTVGQPIRFKLCLKYASQLVQFSWDLPKDSLFKQETVYEFTEIKQRQKVVSEELIPVSDFEWTPLVPGLMHFPSFTISAIAYNGDKVSVKIPDIQVEVLEKKSNENAKVKNYFSDAFELDETEAVEEKNIISTEDCIKLAQLRSDERHSFFAKARKVRVNFEKELKLPYNQKEFKVVWVFVCIGALIICLLFLIYFIKKHRLGMNIIMVVGARMRRNFSLPTMRKLTLISTKKNTPKRRPATPIMSPSSRFRPNIISSFRVLRSAL